ncbi:hypothetical protein HYPSUDRAFT_210109 [Hypholoma sublateritium FD-334 SS-4]|uniref:Uncharacterized protein n=1 Tax=Hypholoma sublateritium (strain FD-334 SS-4) TaxID=945553 RepID=A0A0D2NW68_HYPSF|nr:hypothetical protein HYPSUDRAFT_210109 [Hypholoma sublateritium FD-334 SS-4]
MDFAESESLPYTPPEYHHHISTSRNFPIHVQSFIGTATDDDPAIKGFYPKLQEHILARILHPTWSGDGNEFSDKERNKVFIVNERLYRHKMKLSALFILSLLLDNPVEGEEGENEEGDDNDEGCENEDGGGKEKEGDENDENREDEEGGGKDKEGNDNGKGCEGEEDGAEEEEDDDDEGSAVGEGEDNEEAAKRSDDESAGEDIDDDELGAEDGEGGFEDVLKT